MGHLLKTKCIDSRVNVHILASTSVSLTLTTVQVSNLALTHTKRITVQAQSRESMVNSFSVIGIYRTARSAEEQSKIIKSGRCFKNNEQEWDLQQQVAEGAPACMSEQWLKENLHQQVAEGEPTPTGG
jgi:hypothetical protein